MKRLYTIKGWNIRINLKISRPNWQAKKDNSTKRCTVKHWNIMEKLNISRVNWKVRNVVMTKAYCVLNQKNGVNFAVEKQNQSSSRSVRIFAPLNGKKMLQILFRCFHLIAFVLNVGTRRWRRRQVQARPVCQKMST